MGDALEPCGGVPALVIPANKQLALDWGSHVAEAVRKKAGDAPEKEARAAHPNGIALGEAVLTSAGTLAGFTHLVHAAVLDKYDFNPLFLLRLKERTSRDTLASATRASLAVLDAAGLTGAVMTPMGAGIGGMRDSVCAEIMLRELRAFAPSSLRTIVIRCRKPKTADAFKRLAA